MKLQQLRYLCEIQRHAFNISRAAQTLNTSQSGISKQIALLEQELGVLLFLRKGKHLLQFTAAGEKVMQQAENIVERVEDIHLLAEDFSQRPPVLSIATTHTQARYVLPPVVRRFMRMYPEVKLEIHQGTPQQIAHMLERDDVDIAIATEVLGEKESLLALPCYQWTRSIIMPRAHPLSEKKPLTLEDIVTYPIVTYEQGFTGRQRLDEVFSGAGLTPEIVLTAVDADVIKTYVRLQLGIGILADMALHPQLDADLTAISVSDLFGTSISHLALKKKKYIKSPIYRFIELFAPHLPEQVVKEAFNCRSRQQLETLCRTLTLPAYSSVRR